MKGYMAVLLVVVFMGTMAFAAPISSSGGGSGGESGTNVVVRTETNISSGYQNRVLDGAANGWGEIYGGIIPRTLSSYAYVYEDGSQYRWTATAWASGVFMPTDGTVTPEMSAYATLGGQNTQVNLGIDQVTFQKDGEWWKATFSQMLNLGLSFTALVDHQTWEELDGSVIDYWCGWGGPQVNVQDGFVTNAHSNFWRTDYNDQPAEWQAQFTFSGIAVPGTVIVLPMEATVPEPMTAALLVGGGAFSLFRRRRNRIA